MRSLILRVSVMLAASVFGVTAKTMDDRGLGLRMITEVDANVRRRRYQLQPSPLID